MDGKSILSLLFLYDSLPGGKQARYLAYLGSKETHPIDELLRDEIQLSHSHELRIILLVSIHSHLPFIPQLFHSLHPRKRRLIVSFLLKRLLLVFLPILDEQVIHSLALAYIPSVVWSILVELFKTFDLADGEFGPELRTADQAGDLAPSPADGTMKGGRHGGEGVDVALSLPGLELAVPARELLPALLEDGGFLLILTLILHAQRYEIEIK